MTDEMLQMDLRTPYMVGVYLGVNAVPDVYLIVDGPDCLFFKAEFVFGTHDLRSTLLDCQGRHRIAHTLADTNNIVMDRESEISRLIGRVASLEEAGTVLVSALPVAAITGSQYDRIGKAIAEETGKPILEVPALSLQGDWMDGYSAVLEVLAAGIPLDRTEPKNFDDTVAVVGLLLDRTEADRLADLEELERILARGLGVGVSAFWPSNTPTAGLAAAGRAGTIVSLPYGRKAARTIASRTGARLVEVNVPFGLDGTMAFLRTLGDALGRSSRVEGFIRDELSVAVPLLDLAARRGLRGKSLAYIGDPCLGEWFPPFAKRLDAKSTACISTRHPMEPIAGEPGADILASPNEIDLCVTSSRGVPYCLRQAIPFLEYGFPSYATHAFTAKPTLGFRGSVHFSELMVNQCSLVRDIEFTKDRDRQNVDSGGIPVPTAIPRRPDG